MLLSSRTRLGEIGRDFQRGFMRVKKAVSFRRISLHPESAWLSGRTTRCSAQKAPVPHVRNRRLEMKPRLLYSGDGVAFGFFSLFFGVGVVGASGKPGLG